MDDAPTATARRGKAVFAAFMLAVWYNFYRELPVELDQELCRS
jgi:hypothetical protein